MKDEAFFNIKYKACKQLIWSYCCQFDSQLQYYYLKHFSSVSTCIHLYSPVSTCIHLYSPVLLTCIYLYHRHRNTWRIRSARSRCGQEEITSLVWSSSFSHTSLLT